jgi:hypothetical protein
LRYNSCAQKNYLTAAGKSRAPAGALITRREKEKEEMLKW